MLKQMTPNRCTLNSLKLLSFLLSLVLQFPTYLKVYRITADMHLSCLPGTRYLPLLQNVQTDSGAHLTSYSISIRGFLTGEKRPRREACRSPPSSAEVKNEWSYIYTPLFTDAR